MSDQRVHLLGCPAVFETTTTNAACRCPADPKDATIAALQSRLSAYEAVVKAARMWRIDPTGFYNRELMTALATLDLLLPSTSTQESGKP